MSEPSSNTVLRWLEALRNRLRLVASRVVLARVDDSKGFQQVQLHALKNETRAAVDRLQNYGFTSVPHPGAEGIAVFPGGDRANGIVVALGDRAVRLRGLADGEVAMYDDLGHKVHLTRTGIVVDGAGHQVTVTGTPKVRLECDLEVAGSIVAAGDISDSSGTAQSMAAMRATYNLHQHPDPQGAFTGVPVQPM